MASEQPKTWSHWLPLTEWWYNTNFHTSIQTTLDETVYGQPTSHHSPYLTGESIVMVVDQSLQAREAAIKLLKFHLERA